ncbi:MAG: sulfite exporter TauE/SafE family protein [Bacteroidota bacterium]
MEYVIICIVALFASILTFFSGFGLGTILLPVFAFFFSIEEAIALTGIVHFSNNIFKFFLVGKSADREVLVKFGLPAVLASFAGAWFLIYLSELPSVYTYNIGSMLFEISPVKAVIAVILIFFSLLEVIPGLNNLHFGKDKLPLGGVLSGFFGGLSGIQGAVRSAFLIKCGLTKEGFIATGVVIAILIDLTRLTIYSTGIIKADLLEHAPMMILAIVSALAGALLGKKLLKKVTLKFVQNIVASTLIVIAIALGFGLV